MDFKQLKVSIASISLKPIEWWLRNKNEGKSQDIQPIWVIGAPRSGTTLTYQLLCTYLEAYYLTNRVAEFYRISLLTRIFERKFFSKSFMPSSFQSNYGSTKAPNDPHEGGQFYYQFFPKNNPYTTKDDLNEQQKNRFKFHIELLTAPNKLFISKNTVHSLRINALNEIFSKSIFIWVRREVASTVYSILQARKKFNVSEDDWWGVKPPGWQEAQSLPVVEKTIWQVSKIEKIIKEDLKKTNANWIEVSYKEICESPEDVLKRVLEEYDLQKFKNNKKGLIPNSFSYSTMPQNNLSKKIKLILS